MSTKTRSTARRVITVLGSSGFFKLTLILLVLQAAWIALSGRYPMAFDEDFHLGIIRLYAHHVSPFWDGHPAGADAYGAVARDPSYLYHYLMSFPYRLISLFTASQTAQVLFLRFISIALFAAALPLYRRLLFKTGASRALVHSCLAAFILIPVVPFLAAQINYDNLFLPLTALSMLLAINISQGLRRRQALNVKRLIYLILLLLLTSLVKYAFLPVALAVVCFLAIRLSRTYRQGGLWNALRQGWTELSRLSRGLLIAGLCLSALLFGQRYGVNLARYHDPVPDCAKVLTVKQCSAYGPWIRDYNFTINKGEFGPHRGPLAFMNEWLYGMWLRLFFAVAGPPVFITRGPLAVPALGGLLFTVVGAVAAVLTIRRLFKRYDAYTLWLFVLSSALYVAALWANEYHAYLRTGQPVAINGRYLLPVLPLLMLLGALGLTELLKRRQAIKLSITIIALLCLIWGGGAMTFILRSGDSWYLPGTPLSQANHLIKRVAGPLTPGYSDPTEFLR